MASATGSPAVNATEFTPFRPFSAASTCVPVPEIAASLFFTTRYLPPASRITLRSSKSLATVSLLNVPIIAVVEVSSSFASNLTFSVFFAFEIAMSCSAQTVVSDQ